MLATKTAPKFNAQEEALLHAVGFAPSPLWSNVFVDLKGEAYPSANSGSFRLALQKEEVSGQESFRLLLVCGSAHSRWEWTDTLAEALEEIGAAKARLDAHFKGRLRLSRLEGDYAERGLARILLA